MPEPIFERGPVDTPYTYTVAGTGTVTPLACQAVYDGSGAGGDFVPAVVYRSQDGNVISRATLDETLAAGASAEVSWFPWLRHAATGASFTPQSCAAFSATPIGNVGAGQTAITWTSIQNEPNPIYSIDGTDATKILVSQYGYYLLATEISMVNNPQTFTSQLLLSNEVEDANGLGTLTYITNAISMKDASVADPKEVQILEGFDYWSGATGYTLPFNVRVFLTLGQTINVQRVGMFLTRLSPTPIV